MKTVRLFNISLILFIASMMAAFCWQALGLKNADTPFIAILLIVCFGLNLAGVFVGFIEERKSKTKFLYGVIGNGIFTVLYIGFFVYVLITM